MIEHLILTGFMTSGKSTSGKEAALELEVNYEDTDVWLRNRLGEDFGRLLAEDIPEFRRQEAAVLRDVLRQEPGIVATGGGIVSTEAGRAALLGSGMPVAWLRISFEDAVERKSKDTANDRPLFDDEEKARGLFQERQPWYSQTATHEIDASQPQPVVIDSIVQIAARS